jgi:DNA-binding Xre family transcriptional regulator
MNNTKNKHFCKDIFILLDGLKVEQCTILAKARQKVKWNLKRIISDMGMTQDEVAEKLGWTPSFLSRLVTGKSKIAIKDLQKLCELLNITLDQIFLD